MMSTNTNFKLGNHLNLHSIKNAPMLARQNSTNIKKTQNNVAKKVGKDRKMSEVIA